MKKLLFILILILSTQIIFSQTDFKPGYIIKNSKDTVYGKIDYRGDLLMGSVCKFKSKDNSVIEYSPNDIIAYRFIDGKFYVSRQVNNKPVFLEFLIKGKVNIYYLRDNKGDHYYVDREGTKLKEIPYEKSITLKDHRQYLYESKKHIGLLKIFMQDAPELQSQIEQIKKPEHYNLIKLAEDYHNSVCDDEKCIIYVKKAPLFKISLELLSGVINFNSKNENIISLNDKNYFNGGLIAHVWMPRVNEKMYFRTGLLYSNIQFTESNRSIKKIPIQLEYIYPKGIIQPRISYGPNFYFSQTYTTVSLNGGINVKISKSLFVSITSDVEFSTSTLIIPSDFFSFSANAGLFVKL